MEDYSRVLSNMETVMKNPEIGPREMQGIHPNPMPKRAENPQEILNGVDQTAKNRQESQADPFTRRES